MFGCLISFITIISLIINSCKDKRPHILIKAHQQISQITPICNIIQPQWVYSYLLRLLCKIHLLDGNLKKKEIMHEKRQTRIRIISYQDYRLVDIHV